MAISEAEMLTAPVLLNGSNIPEASFARRKPAGLENANVLFWWRFMCDHERTGHKSTVCFLEFTSRIYVHVYMYICKYM